MNTDRLRIALLALVMVAMFALAAAAVGEEGAKAGADWVALAPSLLEQDLWDKFRAEPADAVVASDLVIVGKVIEVTENVEAAVVLNAEGAPPTAAKTQCVRYRLTVDKRIVVRGNILPKADSSKPATVTAYAVVSDGSGGRAPTVKLPKDTSYVVALHGMPGQEGFFLSNEKGFVAPAEPRFIAAYERVADAGKWPWGEPLDGLQIALLLPRPLRSTGAGLFTTFSCRVAFRNVSDKPIAINLAEADGPMSIKCATDEKSIAGNFAPLLETGPMPFELNNSVWVLKPGQVVLAGPGNRACFSTFVTMPLAVGDCAFRLTYKNMREAKTDDGIQLWTGRLTAEDVEVRVVE